MNFKTKKQLIYDSLEEKIISNKLKTFPSERQLAIKYQCNRNTIREVLKILISDGFIDNNKNKYIVNNPEFWTKQISITSKKNNIIQSLHSLLKNEIPSFFKKIISKFNENKWVGFRKNRWLNSKNNPIEYLDFWLPKQLVNYINLSQLNISISKLLKEKYNAKYSKNWLIIEKSNSYDKKFFNLINLKNKMLIYSIIYSKNNDILQLSVTNKTIANFYFKSKL